MGVLLISAKIYCSFVSDLLAICKTTHALFLSFEVSELKSNKIITIFVLNPRIMIHYVYGALIAMIVPDTQSRSVSREYN